MSWQLAAVFVIELLAVLFLISRFRSSKKPRRPPGPDVDASALVRKRSKSPGGASPSEPGSEG